MLDANVDSLMYVLCGIDLALCCIIIIGGKYWVWLCCFYCSAQNCETPDYVNEHYYTGCNGATNTNSCQ